MIPAVLVLLLLATTTAGPIHLYRDTPPDETEARRELIEEDPTAFREAYLSILAEADPEGPPWGATFLAAAEDYLAVTDDSLLVADLAFVRAADPGTRAAWADAVETDAEGFRLRGERDYEGAIASFQSAAEAYAAMGHLRREAVAWGSLGVAYWFAGDFDGVGASYAKALDARERLGDPVLIGRTLNGLGSMNMQLGDYPESLDYYTRARNVREKIGNSQDLGTTVSFIGNVRYRMNDLAGARAAYREALEILGPDAPPRLLTPARNGLANVHADLGEYEEGMALYQEELELLEEIGDLLAAAQMRMNMAWILKAEGKLGEALRELEMARVMLEAEGDRWELAGVLNEYGRTQLELGNLPAALDAFKESRKMAVESENILTEANSVVNLGLVYSRMGLMDRGREMYDEALVIYDEIGDIGGHREVLVQVSALEYLSENYEESLRLRREALKIDRELESVENISGDQVSISNILARMGRFEESLVASRAATDLARELGRKDALWMGLLGTADTFEQMGELDSAAVYNAQSIEIMEQLRTPSLSDEMRTAFLGKIAHIYEAQVHVLAKLYARTGEAAYAEEALAMAERGKARALLDLLAEGSVDLDTGLDPSLVQERDDLIRELDSVRFQLRMADETVLPDSVKALKRQARNLEREVVRARERVRLSSPRLSTLDAGRPRTVQEIRTALIDGGKTVVLEYVLGDSASYLWAITEKELDLYRLPPRPEVEAEVRRLRGLLVNPVATGDADLVASAYAVEQMVLAPARERWRKAQTVYLVPDGVLHYLPFDVLITEPREPHTDPEKRGKFFKDLPYAFKKSRLLVGPSATTLAVLADGRESVPDRPRDLLAVGDPIFVEGQQEAPPTADEEGGGRRDGLDPLPFTRDEVEAIGDLFEEGRRTLLLGDDAREQVLREPGYLADYRILHFATHGLIDERRPERSSLALSYPRDPTEDGYLRASEIYELDLSADLVVLSACETGLGRMVRGEGVLGLPRAFLYSGASAVVVSLWSVSDRSTSQLMVEFYKEMVKKNRTSSEALARAKEILRKSEEFAHPFHWAPFTHVGPGR